MIETDRLILRPWQDSDAEALFRYASDPDVGPRAGWPPHKDIEESRRVIWDIFTNDRTWAVTLRETGEVIGCMGYFIHGESNIPIGEEDAEIGYWIAKPYWNRGIATEALRAMIDYCFNVKGFLTLWSDFFIDNPASGRVMEKCELQKLLSDQRLTLTDIVDAMHFSSQPALTRYMKRVMHTTPSEFRQNSK